MFLKSRLSIAIPSHFVDNDIGRVWPDRSCLPLHIFRIRPQGQLALRRGVSDAFLLQSEDHAARQPRWLAKPERIHPMREIITLQCPECKNRNYSTTKNKKTTTGRLEFSKFCNTCRKHTAHKETK
jgi:large subunit ribosomal protein L33